jgi:DNA-binding transcriptional MerR regulator
MTERLSISKTAQLYRVSTRTLRFYEDAGLITSHRQADSRYREYDISQRKRLEVILLLRRLSFGVKEIAQLLDGNSQHLRALIQEKIAAANRARAEANEVIHLLGDVLTALHDAPLSALGVDELLGRYIYLSQKTERMVPVNLNEEKYVLLVGLELIPFVQSEPAPDNIFGMVTALRTTLADEGIELPSMRIRDDVKLQPNEMAMYFEGEMFCKIAIDVAAATNESFGKEVVAQIKGHIGCTHGN